MGLLNICNRIGLVNTDFLKVINWYSKEHDYINICFIEKGQRADSPSGYGCVCISRVFLCVIDIVRSS